MVDKNEIDLIKFKLKLKDSDVKKSLAPKFDVFDVLKIKSNEVLNSNVLAWLLNPKETHGLEDSFLKEFFKKFIIKNKSLESNSFDDAQVYTEFNFIDIMVISHSNRFILIIENKIFTDEHDDQLSKYYNYIKSLEFENYKLYSFFLTLDRHEPKKDDDKKKWKAISHSEILEIMESIIEQKTDIEDDVRFFLYNFKKTLGELTMQDDENSKLCDEIYCEFQKEIEYILKNARKPSRYLKAELDKDDRLQHISLKNQGSYDVIRFVTDDLLKICEERKEAKKNPWNTKHDFMVEVFCAPYPTKIKLTFQLITMENADVESLKNKLRSNDIEYVEKGGYLVVYEEKLSLLRRYQNSINEYRNEINIYAKKVEKCIFEEKKVLEIITKLSK